VVTVNRAGVINMALRVISGDPAFFDNRLHYSYIDDPTPANGRADRSFKDSGFVTIVNDGSAAAQILSSTVTGPFTVANPGSIVGAIIPPGGSLTIEVLFNRAAYNAPSGSFGTVDGTSGVFEGSLVLTTNVPGSLRQEVQLAGVWQKEDQNNYEPNLNEIFSVFGFGNNIENLPLRASGGRSVLQTFGAELPVDETEIFVPYWRLAPGVTNAEIVQLVQYTGTSTVKIELHEPGDVSTVLRLWRQAAEDTQTVLPNQSNGSFARANLTNALIPDAWDGADIFGVLIGDTPVSSDARLNPGESRRVIDRDGVIYDVVNSLEAEPVGSDTRVLIADLDLVQEGYYLRTFKAVDKAGQVIPDTYLLAYDTPFGNYDYNDVVLVISGVQPVGEIAPPSGVLVVENLEKAAADARLVFTNIQIPDTSAAVTAVGGQEFRDTATFTLRNDGGSALAIEGLTLSGPGAGAFQIVSSPTSIAAGASAQVVVRFTGTDFTADTVATRYAATLTVDTNASVNPVQTIALAGLAQNRSENRQEPTVADVVWAFGYGTNVAQSQLGNGGRVQAVGDEVLSPYLEALDPNKPVEFVQLASFLRMPDVSRLLTHSIDGEEITELFAADDQQGQTLSPEGLVSGPGSTGAVASTQLDVDGPFGMRVTVDDRPTFSAWSDPRINRVDPDIGSLVNAAGTDRGHLIRFFRAEDAAGNVIPGTLIGIQDYVAGGNYDYQDVMFLVRNVKPHTLGPLNDGNGNGVNDAIERDGDNDGTLDFFDFTDEPTQTAFNAARTPWNVNSATGLNLSATLFDDGGQGVAYNDTTPRLDTTGYRPDVAVDFSRTLGAVGYVAAGEWLEYTINVVEAGDYALNLLVGTPNFGRSIVASFAKGGTVYETVDIDVQRTGGFKVFQETADEIVTLQSGQQVLRIAFETADQDLSRIILTPFDLAA
jgi:hypothetical protein